MTMPNDASLYARKRRKARFIVGTLAVSVFLNLFLVGTLAGSSPPVRPRHFPLMALTSRHGVFLADGMARYLGDADAAAFREITQSKKAAMIRAQKRMRMATANLADTFEQDLGGQEALKKALDSWSMAKVEVESIAKEIVTEGYAKLSPDGRHRLAELNR